MGLKMRPGVRGYFAVAFFMTAAVLPFSQAPAQGVEVLAIAGAVNKAYNAYKDMIALLKSGDPTQQDLIVAKLAVLENDFHQIQVGIDQINAKIEEEMQLGRRAFFLDNLKQLQLIRGTARTGAEEVALWVQGRKQDSTLMEEAKHDSLHAASQMLEGAGFFLRPGQGDTDFVSDYRSALPAYLYIMTVRLGVLSIAEPNFQANPVYQDEFRQHVKRLDEILASINGPLSCIQTGQPPTTGSGGFYDICSYCSDPVTNANSFIDGELPKPLTVNCENPLPGSDQDFADDIGFFKFYDRYQTQKMVGYVDLRNLRDLVETNTHSSQVVQFYQYHALIGFGAKCLTAPRMEMQPCNGSPAQEWQGNDGFGALRSLGLCLQVQRFRTSNGTRLETDECSRAPGERWTLTAAGDIRGIGGKCLDVKDFSTANGAPVQMWDCTGAANQQWSWSAPPGPAISAIDPSSGPVAGGTYVHIMGNGFDPAGLSGSSNTLALFNDIPSDYVLCQDSMRCTVRSPKVAAPGAVFIGVQVSGVSSTQTALFTYHAHPMLTGIDSFVPEGEIAIVLDGYAPDGGTTVAVQSSNPTVLSVPATVTVPAGSSGVTFPIGFLPTPNAGTVTVTASYEGVALSTKVGVAAWPPLSVNLGAASALGNGASSTATVSLNTPAPAGGAVVTLSSSDPSAISVPASLTVRPGEKTAAVTITNHYSGLPEQVTIGASYNGLTASDALYVPKEPSCRPHTCPKGFHFDPDSCGCARGLPQ